MKRTFLAATTAVALTATPAAADLIRVESAHDVDTTIDRLAAAVEGAGAKVFARIEHARGAASVGMDLAPSTALIFGNPKLGTPVMQSAQETGLDLPMHVLAYEAADGKVWVVYRTAAAIGQARGMSADAPELMRIAKALDGLTNAAIAE